MNEKEIWVTEDGSAPVLWRAGLVCWEGRPRALWTCFPKPRRRSQGPSYSSCSWVLFSTPKPEAPSKQKLPLAPHTNSRKALKGLEEIKGALINPDFLKQKRGQEISAVFPFRLSPPHPSSVLFSPEKGREEACSTAGVSRRESCATSLHAIFLVALPVCLQCRLSSHHNTIICGTQCSMKVQGCFLKKQGESIIKGAGICSDASGRAAYAQTQVGERLAAAKLLLPIRCAVVQPAWDKPWPTLCG